MLRASQVQCAPGLSEGRGSPQASQMDLTLGLLGHVRRNVPRFGVPACQNMSPGLPAPSWSLSQEVSTPPHGLHERRQGHVPWPCASAVLRVRGRPNLGPSGGFSRTCRIKTEPRLGPRGCPEGRAGRGSRSTRVPPTRAGETRTRPAGAWEGAQPCALRNAAPESPPTPAVRARNPRAPWSY